MTGFSHTTTGVVIALSLHNPLLVLPAALASHFVLDALPHYGDNSLTGADKSFRRFILYDAYASFGLVFLMMILIPEYRLLIALCAALATVPDLMWLPNHIRETRGRPAKPLNKIMHFHRNMQFEHPAAMGILAEAIWLVGMLSLLAIWFLAR